MKKSAPKKKETLNVGQELRNLGALVEDNNHQLRAVAEQYGDIKKTLDEHTEKFDSHTEMIGKLLVDVDIVKTNVGFMKNELKKKVDYDEFIALERRVHSLESKSK